MYDEQQLGGNSRLLFADSCQTVLFLQTSRLNQYKTIPEGQDIFKCFVKKKDKQGYFFFWKLTAFLPSVCSLNPFASKSSFLRPEFIPLQFVCFHNLCWQQKD